MRKTKLFGLVLLITLAAVNSLPAQEARVKLSSTEQADLRKFFIYNDFVSCREWLRKNPQKANGEFDNGAPLIAVALAFDATSCINPILEAKADPNVVYRLNDEQIDRDLFFTLVDSIDDSDKIKSYLQTLLNYGYDLNKKLEQALPDNEKFQFTDSGAIISAYYKNSRLVQLLPWLVEKGLDPTILCLIYSSSSELLYSFTPAMYLEDRGMTELAKAFSEAETRYHEIQANREEAQYYKIQEEKENASFLKVTETLNRYHGKEELNKNLDLLTNPNSFEEQEGYYFSIVIPIKWLSRDRVVCHSVDLSLLGNRGESNLFVVYIEESNLRKSFSTSTITSPFGASLEFGFDVIVTPADDQQYDGALPYLKLLSMKPAKLSLSF
jgi:hypothetical protein